MGQQQAVPVEVDSKQNAGLWNKKKRIRKLLQLV